MDTQSETTVNDSEKKKKSKKRRKTEDEAQHPEAELESNAMVVDSVDPTGMSSAILKMVPRTKSTRRTRGCRFRKGEEEKEETQRGKRIYIG